MQLRPTVILRVDEHTVNGSRKHVSCHTSAQANRITIDIPFMNIVVTSAIDFGQFRLRPAFFFEFGQFRLRPISTSANFDFGQFRLRPIFSDVEFLDHKGWGPEGWRPRRVEAPKGGGPNLEKVGPRRVEPRRVEPRRVGGPKFRAFFPLFPPQFSFFSLSWGLFVEFWWCLKRRGREMCTFGALAEAHPRMAPHLMRHACSARLCKRGAS